MTVHDLLVKLFVPSLYMVPVKMVRRRLAVNALYQIVSQRIR